MPHQRWYIYHDDSVTLAASRGVRIEAPLRTGVLCLSSNISDNVAREQGFGLSMQPYDRENATRWYLREHEAPADSYGTFLGTKAKGTGCLHFSGAHDVKTTDDCPIASSFLGQKYPDSNFFFFGQTIQSASFLYA